MTIPFELHLHHPDSGTRFSDDGKYRYSLKRHVADDLPWMGVVGNHPTTVGRLRSDPITRQLITLTKHWGGGGFELCNLAAGICTGPQQLANLVDPIGPDNDFWLQHLAETYDFILLCWGSAADPVRARSVTRRLWHAMEAKNGTLATLGWTSGTISQPRQLTRDADATALQSLTATPDIDDTWIDPRWAQLIADTAFLDTDIARPHSRRTRRVS